MVHCEQSASAVNHSVPDDCVKEESDHLNPCRLAIADMTSSLSRTSIDDTDSRKLPAAFFLLGIGSLLPFNALLSVLDYYKLLFPSMSISQFITNAYSLPFMIIGVIVTIFPPPPRLRAACIFTSYLLMLIVSVLFPLLTTRRAAFVTVAASLASRQLVSILVLSAFLGLANVLDQTVLYGLIGLFPDTSCTTSFNTGSAFASILLVLLRVFTRLLLDDPASTEPHSLHAGVNLFFAVCILVCLTCILVFRWMYYYSAPFAHHVRSIWEATTLRQPLTPTTNAPRTLAHRLRTASDTLRDVAVPAVCQFVCFALTLMIFPSIMTVIPFALRASASPVWASWYPLTVVAAFAVGDTLGRIFISGQLAVTRPNALPLLTVLRLILLPLLPLQWVGVIPTTWFVAFLSVFAHGYINGFLMNMAFIIAPLQTTETRREAAGRFVFIMLNIGIFTGTASAWLLQTLLRNWFSF